MNAHFDKKVYRNAYPNRRNRGGSGGGSAIDMPQTNFFKYTPTEEPLETSTSAPSTPRTISQLPIQRPITNSTQSNRNLLRSGSHRRRRPQNNQVRSHESSSLLDQFEGLKAIHYVGEVGGRAHDARVYEGEGNQINQDGIFRFSIFYM